MSIDPRDNRGYAIIQGVVAQALADDDYRKRLLANPVVVLRAAGLTISDYVEVKVHENTPDRVHFVLPIRPGTTKQLDIDEVEIVAISHHWPI